VRVEDHTRASTLEREARGQQLGIVEMIDIGLKRPRPGQHAPRRAEHAVEPAARSASIEDLHTVALLVAEAIGHHQRNRMASGSEATALLEEDARVAACMDG